ncbi:MAG: hypothetical protein FWC58_01240 [Desulfobulbus sp.]|nr:hypothetical protein [Desulfobulbus sp.]
MNRITLREASRQYAAAKAVDPLATVDVELFAINNDPMLRFTAVMTIKGVDSEVAADNGKLKVFANVDDFLKFVAKAAESGDGVYNVKVDTGMILASKVPGNMLTWAQSQIARLAATKPKQQKVIDLIDAQLATMAGWETGNQAQQAKKAELSAQRGAVVTDMAAIDAEVSRLQALLV